MRRSTRHLALALGAVGAAAVLAACAMQPSSSATGPMSFFVTSVGSGKGADLGGLTGADAPAATATAAATPGTPSVNARDRIGNGPWFNAKGAMVARDLNHLHNGNNLSKETALDEKGNGVKGRGDTPNEHDILTGSRADGTAFAPGPDTTCKAWTNSGDGTAIVGHHDRSGPLPENWAKSWNFSHQSAGCSQEALVRTGGAGKFYCFASN